MSNNFVDTPLNIAQAMVGVTPPSTRRAAPFVADDRGLAT